MEGASRKISHVIIGNIDNKKRVTKALARAANRQRGDYGFIDDLRTTTVAESVPEQNIHEHSRRAINALKADIDQSVPFVSRSIYQPGYTAFLFSQLFQFANRELAALFEALAHKTSDLEVIIWDSCLPQTYVASLKEASARIECLGRDHRKDMNNLAASLYESTQAQQDHKTICRKNVPLIVIGADVDIDLGVKYLRHHVQATQCYLLLKRREVSLYERFAAHHPDIDVLAVFFQDALTISQHERLKLFSQMKKFVRSSLAETPYHVQVALPFLVGQIGTALGVQKLVMDLHPNIIFGTFEKSPLGVMLSALRRIHDFELVSYQHGVLSKTHSMDFLDFDTFYVWSEEWKNLVVADGYRNKSQLEVLDLRYDDLETSTAKPRLPDWAAALPFSRHCVFFEQPLQKSPYSQEEYVETLKEISRVTTAHEFNLIIKPHPKTVNDPDYAKLTQSVPHSYRLLGNLSVVDISAHCDIAVGFTSTALLDFSAMDKPAISFDKKNWCGMIGMPSDVFAYRAENEEELRTLFSELYSA